LVGLQSQLSNRNEIFLNGDVGVRTMFFLSSQISQAALAAAFVLFAATTARADFLTSRGLGAPEGFPTAGSTYFIAPGAGTSSGFQLAGGPFLDSTINGVGEIIGPDISGEGDVLSSDFLIHNLGQNYDFILRVETVGGNLLPMGIIGDSGVPLVTLGLFVGGGLNPVDTNSPLFANTAVIEVFNRASESLGIIDVIGLSNFTTGKGGGWDGSLGLNFGNQIVIGDVGAIEFRINFDAAIPEPTSASIFGCLGLGLLVRRRR
jgi:hypothetical protein